MKVVEILSETIIIISVLYYGDQLWSKCRLRKRANCVYCRNEIETENAFRPTTNAGNRSDRLCLFCANHLINEYKKEG